MFAKPFFTGRWFAGLLCAGVVFLITLPVASRTQEARTAQVEQPSAKESKKPEETKNVKAPLPSVPLAKGALPDDWTKALHWRSIGPGSMGGRIVALAVYEADPTTWWVATASGGLLKTSNNGVTFEHQFDREATVSIGDVQVAPSDKNIVWVGTGENNPRNSVSYGDGVYKSTDGGKKWTNMGLKKTFQIGKMAIHPKNPDIVYVGALGRLYGPNEERGVFKTIDGGHTWERVLFLDDKTGVIDLVLDPNEPDTLYAAAWERLRDGFDSHPGNAVPVAEGYDRYDPIKKWGPKSGIYKTSDGGKNWTKLSKGLPTCETGRIGLDIFRKNTKTLYAIIDSAKIGMGAPPRTNFLGVQGENAEGGVKLVRITPSSPAEKGGLKANDVVKMLDTEPVKDYEDFVDAYRERKAGSKIALTVQRGDQIEKLNVTLEDRPGFGDQGGGPGPGGSVSGRFPGLMLLGALAEDGDGGAKITRLFPSGAAGNADLKVDDVIKSLDKQPIPSAARLNELLVSKKVGDKVAIEYVRDKTTKTVEVTLTDPPQGFGPGTGSRTRPYTFLYGGQRPNAQHMQGSNSHEYGGVYRSTDGGESWTRINSLNPRPMYFSLIRVDPSDEKYVYVGGANQMYRSVNGGKKFTADAGVGVHPDHHALWIDPKDGRHLIVGCDGGVYVTYDRTTKWDFHNHAAIGQFYHVALDSRRPYRVFGGLQDNGTWGGPSHSLNGTLLNEDWITVNGGDGFVCRVDPTDPDLVYGTTQDGGIFRKNLRTGEQAGIRPREDGRTGYRFNWNTPFILSSHNPSIFYSAGNVVFRSVKRGAELKVISPEITRTKRGSATALAESPRNSDVLYVGTDDGYLWVTRDGGTRWTNVTEKMLAKEVIAAPRWVSTIEPSRFKEGRCYICLDGHRSDDDEPYLFMTDDYGETWTALRNNLPTGSTRCLREDIKNEEVLYLGTEFAVFASLDRGKSWTKINNNLPTVAVHELAQHPTTGEMVAATHGRSIWILDVSALRQMKATTPKDAVTLYVPTPAMRWRSEPNRGSMYGVGSRRFVGESAPNGAVLYYSLGRKPEKSVSLKIVDIAGATVSTLRPENASEPGLHRVIWNFSGGRGPRGGPGQGSSAPGMYRVVLTVDNMEYSQPLRVEADPVLSAMPLAVEQEEEMEPAKEPAKQIREDD